MRKLKTGVMALAILSAAFFYSCKDKDDTIPEELVSGYWLQTGDFEEGYTPLLLSFNRTGEVFNYLFHFDYEDDLYHISLDTTWGVNDKYLIDEANSMLFIAPDKWFYILRLTDDEMTLRRGDTLVNFFNLENDDVKRLAPDEFRSSAHDGR